MADFIPAFEGKWKYQSFLVLPTGPDLQSAPGCTIASRKWAMGELLLADGVDMGAAGSLTFPEGPVLSIKVEFEPGKDGAPANFRASGIGKQAPTTGAEYQLLGWAYPNSRGELEAVRGTIRAVRGPDARPAMELGQMPAGTVGTFLISKDGKESFVPKT